MADSGRIPAGFSYILYGAVDPDGFLNGADTNGPAAGGVSPMKRLYGAKTAPVAVKEPTIETATGDDQALASFQFEAAELPDGVLTTAPRDLEFDALVQGTKTYALNQQRFGVLQPGNNDPAVICLILMRRAKTWGVRSKGSKVYDGLLIPACTITPMGSEFTERAINAISYKINVSKAAHFIWGETFTDANIGSDAAPLIPFDSDHAVHAVALLGDGSETDYDVPYTPISAARSLIYVERVLKTTPAQWTLTGKTYTFAGGSKPASGARGVIWYETSQAEVV